MTEEWIERIYESWGNSYGFPSEGMKERIIAFGKMLLKANKGKDMVDRLVEYAEEVDNYTVTATESGTTSEENVVIMEDLDEED